jgi:hypothetical protein
MDTHQPRDQASTGRARSPTPSDPDPDPHDVEVAVELRTAATVIIGSAQLLARRARLGNVPTAERIQRDMATIEEAARRVVDQAREIERRRDQRR